MKLELLTIARVNYRCQQKVPVSVSCCGSASLPYLLKKQHVKQARVMGGFSFNFKAI